MSEDESHTHGLIGGGMLRREEGDSAQKMANGIILKAELVAIRKHTKKGATD
jgi:hypothetical protein